MQRGHAYIHKNIHKLMTRQSNGFFRFPVVPADVWKSGNNEMLDMEAKFDSTYSFYLMITDGMCRSVVLPFVISVNYVNSLGNSDAYVFVNWNLIGSGNDLLPH